MGEIERVQQDGVSPREVQKAINQYEFIYYQEIATASGKASVIGNYQATIGDFAFSQDLLKRVSKVSQNDVKRVARKYLISTNRTVVCVKKKA